MKKETIALTSFRANLYALVDHMLETGEPLWIERHGKLVKVAEEQMGKSTKKSKKPKKYHDLSKIIPLDIMVEDPDWYISPKLYEWSGEIDPNVS